MLDFKETKKIFNTLPIGYYLGKNIETELSETEQGSYFDPFNEKIVVSFPMLNQLKNSSGERDIRCLLYHEISHVLLTPKNLKDCWGYEEAINIFEDERIETINRNYFLDVDFKNFVKKVCEWDTTDKTTMNDEMKYYACVRFDYGDQKYIDMKNDIIKKYAYINATHNNSDVSDYRNEIIEFYKLFVNNDLERNKENQTYYKERSNDFDNRIKNLTDTLKELENKKQDAESHGRGTKTIEKQIEKIKNEIASALSSKKWLDDEIKQIEKEIKKMEIEKNEREANENPQQHESLILSTGAGMEKAKATEIINSLIKQESAIELHGTIEKLLVEKEHKNFDGGYKNYHGKIQPKSVAKDYSQNYKWFIKKDDYGNEHRNSKLLLNLFIDESGSMGNNETKVRGIIKTMNLLADTHKDFDFNLVGIGGVENIKPKKWKYDAHCGSCFTYKLKEIFNQLQDRNCQTYNLFIMDGSFNGIKEHIKSVDTNNTIIVSDRENESAIKQKIKNAKYKIITCDYVDVLEKELCNLCKQVIR